MSTTSPKPNFLIIMSDEHGAQFSSVYGHPMIETPNMERLGQSGVTVENGYCNSPLCVPSRLSFMTGKYVSRIQGWDNAKPLSVDQLTWAWLLKSKGYQTILNGKMHLLGNHLYGFDKQITRDLHAEHAHPVVKWKERIEDRQLESLELSQIGSSPEHKAQWDVWPEVLSAGPGTSEVISHDDDVEEASIQFLRNPGEDPFALCVGFISPHFPLKVPDKYFYKYYPDNVDLPNLPKDHLKNLPVAARRLQKYTGTGGPYTDDQTLRARAAYFGLITYLDEKIGNILNVLEETGLADDTVVIYTSDHGEMAGEHGLWRKMSFYEQSSKIPMQISWPKMLPRNLRLDLVASNVDLVATILDLAGVETENWKFDGDSLIPKIQNSKNKWKNYAFAEHLAHGTDAPRAMLRKDHWKICYTHKAIPELELYNLKEDPGEFNNLANMEITRTIQENLVSRILEIWDNPDKLTDEIQESQEARYLIRSVTNEEDRVF